VDLKGRLAGGGWQLEACWGGGTSCELVREWSFLGSGVPVKQLRSRRKAWRARSVLGTQPDPRSQHQMLGKTLFSKKAHEKTHVHRAKFNGRPKLPGWPGKRWRSPESGRAVAFIEGGR
jgi:hypothetical protein